MHAQHGVPRGTSLPRDIAVNARRCEFGALVSKVDLTTHRSGDVRDGLRFRFAVLAQFSRRVDVQIRVGRCSASPPEGHRELEQIVCAQILRRERDDAVKRD